MCLNGKERKKRKKKTATRNKRREVVRISQLCLVWFGSLLLFIYFILFFLFCVQGLAGPVSNILGSLGMSMSNIARVAGEKPQS
jgi:hypothetical protein